MVAIANDAQGAEVAKPWIRKAGGTYRALLDRHNSIAKMFGLKYVPVGIFLDEDGRLVRAVGSVNIGDEPFREELLAWASTGAIPSMWSGGDGASTISEMTFDEREADARFQLALALLDKGGKKEAIIELQKAFRMDPQNWLIRKQLWAIEHPQAFYDGDVDFEWQSAQIARESSLV